MPKLRSGREIKSLPEKKRKQNQKANQSKKSQTISPQQAEIFLPKTAKVSRKGLEPQLVTKRRNWKKNGNLTTTEIKLLESKYTRGIPAYGREKILRKSTNLKLESFWKQKMLTQIINSIGKNFLD